MLIDILTFYHFILETDGHVTAGTFVTTFIFIVLLIEKQNSDLDLILMQKQEG